MADRKTAVSVETNEQETAPAAAPARPAGKKGRVAVTKPVEAAAVETGADEKAAQPVKKARKVAVAAVVEPAVESALPPAPPPVVAPVVEAAPAPAIASGPRLRVTLFKSGIGFKYDQKRTLSALGLRRLNTTVELPDNASVRGMLFKVRHLVRVEEIGQA